MRPQVAETRAATAPTQQQRGEIRVNDEEPVQGEALPGEGEKDLGAVRGGQVQEQVAGQDRQPQEKQGAKPAGTTQGPPERGSQQGEQEQGRQGMGKAPVVADKGQAVDIDHEIVEVRPQGEGRSGQGAPTPGGTGQHLGDQHARGQVGYWIHGHLPVWVP